MLLCGEKPKFRRSFFFLRLCSPWCFTFFNFYKKIVFFLSICFSHILFVSIHETNCGIKNFAHVGRPSNVFKGTTGTSLQSIYDQHSNTNCMYTFWTSLTYILCWGAAVAEWLSLRSKRTGVRFPVSPLEFSEIGYLLLPSQDMAKKIAKST